jgi:hypothetical protein
MCKANNFNVLNRPVINSVTISDLYEANLNCKKLYRADNISKKRLNRPGRFAIYIKQLRYDFVKNLIYQLCNMALVNLNDFGILEISGPKGLLIYNSCEKVSKILLREVCARGVKKRAYVRGSMKSIGLSAFFRVMHRYC